MITTTLTDKNIHVLWALGGIEDPLIIEMDDKGCILHQVGDKIYLSTEQIKYISKLFKK